MAAIRSLCGPLELAMAYDGKLELLVDVLYIITEHSIQLRDIRFMDRHACLNSRVCQSTRKLLYD